jgi:hypothetical protein
VSGSSEYERGVAAWAAAVAKVGAWRDEAARSLGGQLVMLQTGDWPVAAVRFEGEHVLLFEQSSSSFSARLPPDREWHFSSLAAWNAARDEVALAIADYRARHPQAVSIADVLAKIVPVLSRVTPYSMSLGRNDLRTATIGGSGYAVQLAVQGDAVAVKMAVGEGWQSLVVDAATLGDGFVPWFEKMLATQSRHLAQVAAAKAEEIQRKQLAGQALFESVLAALREGKVFVQGGGRWFKNYSMRGASIHLEEFDEGASYEADISEAALLAAIEANPEVFGAKK